MAQLSKLLGGELECHLRQYQERDSAKDLVYRKDKVVHGAKFGDVAHRKESCDYPEVRLRGELKDQRRDKYPARVLPVLGPVVGFLEEKIRIIFCFDSSGRSRTMNRAAMP